MQEKHLKELNIQKLSTNWIPCWQVTSMTFGLKILFEVWRNTDNTKMESNLIAYRFY